jgi:D-inositol-3-phosphate glycosyltransferase
MTAPSGSALRVLFVSHYYPPHCGGIEHVVRQEAVSLAARGVDVTVLTSGRHSVTSMRDGVRVVRIAAWNGAERRAGIPFPLLSPRLFGASLRWVRWADVVHVHDCLYMTSWAALAAVAVTRTPLVMTQHVGLVRHPSAVVCGIQHVVYSLPGRLLMRRARRVFTVNGSVAGFTVGLGARVDRIVHLPNGVDSVLFRPAVSAGEKERARRRLGLPQDRPLVLFVGRLVPKKGFDLLLAAREAEPNPSYDLVFAGDGERSAMTGRRGVHPLGALPSPLLAEAYRACDVYALPSVSEGFPLTVQEAMASGLPVLTSDDSGYGPYGLNDDQARLLPRRIGVWSAALAELTSDAARRAVMGACARAYALEHFDWDGHVTSLLGHYDAVIRGHPVSVEAARAVVT